MKTIYNTFLLLLVVLVSNNIFAQGDISGSVKDALGQPLAGANVVIQGLKTGVSTDFDGNFSLKSPKKNARIAVSYLGFTTRVIPFSSYGDIGVIVLQENAQALDAVVVTARGVIDLAEDRQTPIAVSTITAKDLQKTAGSFDIPEVLKSTPSLQNITGGGFGDGAMFLRGFDQTNTAFLLNGQPINGMEDGKMYWSNWSGVMDIANAIQVQRGLGSSKLAISSVGGTVNIVTKTIDQKPGGFLQSMFGNNDYLKTTAYFSTGMSQKGWSFSGMFGHWQGDGYMNGAAGQGQTYFLSVGYKPSTSHVLNLLVTGAPQWHNSGGYRVKLKDYLANGHRYNNNYDAYAAGAGGIYSRGRNFYHKPVLNLSWDFTIDDKSSLSTVAYGSFGRGGFATYSGFSFSKGQHSLEQQIADPGKTPFSAASMNNHNWFGVVSNYNRDLSESLHFNFGFDGRMYNGKHYKQLVDNFGQGPVTISNDAYSVTVSKAHGFNPWDALFNPLNDDTQKFDRNYQEWIHYIGGFGQLEYSRDAFSAFFQGSVSTQSYQREGFLIEKLGQTGLGKSKKENKLGYNLKTGLAYELTPSHKVFANAGYYSRQPFLDNIFTSVRYENTFLKPAVDNEEIIGLEFGYQFTNNNNLTANINAYHTTWGNRTINLTRENQALEDEALVIRDAEQVHMGIELETTYRPIQDLKVTGFLSLGDWKYTKNVKADKYLNGVLQEQTDYYIKDVKVGQASQVTAGIGADYTFLSRISVNANWNWYNDLYGRFNIDDTIFEQKQNQGAVALPSYDTVDAGLGYTLPLFNDKNAMEFRFNVKNVFDERYLESSSNIHANGQNHWKGVSVDNEVRFGYGRTWNFTMRYTF